MLGKIFASLVIIIVLYVFGVFFAPVLTDNIAEKLWVLAVNTTIRQLKDGADSTSTTLLQIQGASGAINGVRGIVNEANQKLNETTEVINTIRQAGGEKIQQVQRTADSIRKASEAISEVQNNVSELTNLSGSLTLSGSLSWSLK